MNLDDKLKLAHEWAMSMLAKDPRYSDATDFNIRAWQYADAMESEYNKRKPSGFPDALLTKDRDGKCIHFHTTLNRTECFDCGEVLNKTNNDFQPDWSQAPDWANWWVVTKSGQSAWLDSKPKISSIGDYWCLSLGRTTAPSFNYQGDWKDSLRKRPEEQKYKCNCAHWKNSTFFMGDTFKCGDCGGMVTI